MATVILTVGLAFIGYLATYFNGLRLAQRQARLTRVNLQLSDFYGPLFALMEANSRTYDTFYEKYARPDGRDPFDHDIPPTEHELAEWRKASLLGHPVPAGPVRRRGLLSRRR